MAHLTRADLLSLEDYAAARSAWRDEIMALKRLRRLQLGPNATLHFENQRTMQYQIQEMLRAERIFEADGIQEELDAYNPLIPDGNNLKATLMVEFADPEERAERLRELIGVEDQVWVQVAGFDRVHAIADEDMERERQDKTSSVHFLRFQLAPAMITALHQGGDLAAGIDHPALEVALDPIPRESRDSLVSDLAKPGE